MSNLIYVIGFYGELHTVNYGMAADIYGWSSNVYFKNCAIVAWAHIVSHNWVSNLIPVSLPRYVYLATDLTI